jgi:hypothetical protein
VRQLLVAGIGYDADTERLCYRGSRRRTLAAPFACHRKGQSGREQRACWLVHSPSSDHADRRLAPGAGVGGSAGGGPPRKCLRLCVESSAKKDEDTGLVS